MSNRCILLLTLTIMICATPGIARTLDEPEDRGSQSDRYACTPDVFRLCGMHIPNVPEIVSCLRSQKRNLSPDCRVVFDRRPVRRVRGRE